MTATATERRALHLLPRCTGAGPERSLLASITFAPDAARHTRHTIAVLDAPVAAPMFIMARRAGAKVLIRPDDETLRAAAAESDVVVIHFWNHPLLLTTLGRVDLGATRIVVWSMVLGLHAPQVLGSEIGRYADVLVLTTERSLHSAAARTAEVVRVVPGIADMRRLDHCRPLPHEGVVVGYLGSVTPTKMHPRFAELCALVRHTTARFVVVGSGGGEERLQRRVDELGLTPRLRCAGYVDDIANELATFDIFGYPLCADTYATSEKSLQEAMWVGVPPVVFPHGGLVDLVDDGATGLVVTDDEGYGQAIDRLAADRPLRRRLGDEARRMARHRFDPHRLAAAWSDVLDTALTLPRRSRALLHEGRTGAALFTAALGDEAGPFAIASTDGTAEVSVTDRHAAEEEIARSTPLVVGGDGGLVHHLTMWPDDPVLRRWVDLTRRAS